MASRITLALIGRGHWGQVYRKTVAALAASDASGDGSTIALPETNIFGRDYATADAVARIRASDGVIIAATTAAHAAIATDLLTQGVRRILIEKPLTATIAEARALETMLRTMPDAIVMVDHTLCYDPAYRVMRDAAPRMVGTITEVRYTSLKAPHIEGPTIIPDAGSPPIALFLDIAGAMPVTVEARPMERDHVALTLTFPNGMRGVATIGTDHPERKRELAMVGERGSLVLNEFLDPRTLVARDGSGTATSVPFPSDHTALEHAILTFTDCVRTDKQPPTPFAAGLAVVAVIARAIASFQRGGEPVPCDTTLDQEYAHSV